MTYQTKPRPSKGRHRLGYATTLRFDHAFHTDMVRLQLQLSKELGIVLSLSDVIRMGVYKLGASRGLQFPLGDEIDALKAELNKLIGESGGAEYHTEDGSTSGRTMVVRGADSEEGC